MSDFKDHHRAFGAQIKELREAINLPQNDLARLLEVSPSYLSKLERGRLDVLPSYEVLCNMAAIFRVPASTLTLAARKLDLQRLQRLANSDARVARLLHRIANEELSEAQLQMIEHVLSWKGEPA